MADKENWIQHYTREGDDKEQFEDLINCLLPSITRAMDELLDSEEKHSSGEIMTYNTLAKTIQYTRDQAFHDVITEMEQHYPDVNLTLHLIPVFEEGVLLEEIPEHYDQEAETITLRTDGQKKWLKLRYTVSRKQED